MNLNNPDYDIYAGQCIEELKIIQEKFNNDYNINYYNNWYYDQGTGLFTFSKDDDEINFKYFQVGSYSPSENTWMWSWYNKNTFEKVKEKARTINTFGKEKEYKKLLEGQFQSNEFDAWEFTSIALKLTNGIGVYRPVSDNNLQIFIVLLEQVDNATAKKIKDNYIDCDKHDSNRIAFVCRHLNFTQKVGFEEAFETHEGMELEEEDSFQAWCTACEEVRQQEDEWNEISMAFADIKLVCEKCYFDMKEVNLGRK